MPELHSSARPVRDAYRLWSAHYEDETAVSVLEDRAVEAVSSPAAGRVLLDAGCGVGRRVAAATGARLAVGVDLVPEMLVAGRRRWPHLGLAAADVRALPLAADRFDLVWCRLALGHLPSIEGAYRELARVARPGAEAIVTDFHPDAVRAGHERTFRDGDGRVHRVEHYVHEADRHEAAARAAGWERTQRRDVEVGPLIRDFYEGAGRLDLYERQVGLALVLLLRFVKRPV